MKCRCGGEKRERTRTKKEKMRKRRKNHYYHVTNNFVNNARTAQAVTTESHDKEATRLAPPVNGAGGAEVVRLGLKVGVVLGFGDWDVTGGVADEVSCVGGAGAGDAVVGAVY